MRWIITGGAGFIGSQFVRSAVTQGWADDIVVLDALTYAGNLDNLAPIKNHKSWRLVRGDIQTVEDVEQAMGSGCDAVFHFAAESHVDRSILGASDFVRTNVLGTQVVLDVARARGVNRFVHVSTDEVYGSLALEDPARFTEQTPLDPTSPYSASKAASDHLVAAAQRTHGINTVITRCSNNYGPYQFPEKFVPLFITNGLDHKDMPLYGDGKNVRDWIHVDDHVDGIHKAYQRGTSGAVYNLGGECERANRDIAYAIATGVGAEAGRIVPVADRLAHDRRYAIDCSLAQRELGFVPGAPIEERLDEVIGWYKDNRTWWEAIKAGAYRHYYAMQYGQNEGMQPS